MNSRVFMYFGQNWLKQEVIHYVPRSTKLWILCGIRKKCHSYGRNVLLYLIMKMDDKTDCTNFRGDRINTKFYPMFSSQS